MFLSKKEWILLRGLIFSFSVTLLFAPITIQAAVLFQDNFDDNSLDSGQWVKQDSAGDFIRAANRKLYVLGGNGWGTSSLLSKSAFPRTANLTLVATIEPRRSGIAVGFKDAGNENNLKNMVSAFYLIETKKNDTITNTIQIYENGQVKENPEWGWLSDYPYKLKIVLNPDKGAKYYIQGVSYAEFGGNEWTLLYDSKQPQPAELKVGLVNGIEQKGSLSLSDWVLKLDDLYLASSSQEAPLFIKNVMLAQPSTSNITLLIKTNILSDITVLYGADPKYGQTVASEKALIHEISIPNLKPATQYHYQIKAAESGRPENSFTTADQTFSPAVGAGTGFSFALLGDMQRCEIGQTIAALSADQPDFIVTVGDNIGGERAYFAGDFSYRWQSDVFDYLQGLTNHLPLFVTPGNHDYLKRKPQALTVYQQELSLPANGQEERYYSFDYGDAHFAVLDSTTNISEGTIGAEQVDWLEADLAKSTKHWKFVFAHHLIYGTDDSKFTSLWRLPEYDLLHNILVKQKVTAYFCGHRHVYNRYIKNGVVYLCNPSAGVDRCLLNGQFGEDNYLNDKQGEPGTLPKAMGNLTGYTKVNVNPQQVELVVYKNDGTVVDKYLIK